MEWIQVWHKMMLMEECMSIIVKGMSVETGPVEMGNMTSPSEVAWVQLKLTRTLVRFWRFSN